MQYCLQLHADWISASVATTSPSMKVSGMPHLSGKQLFSW
jgi:hypothetical protein